MQEIERLKKRWQDGARFRPVHASMCLEKEGLMLGAKTVLAKRRGDGALALDGEEARLLTLLAVAYGRPVDAGIIGKIRRASKHARAGDEAMAVDWGYQATRQKQAREGRPMEWDFSDKPSADWAREVFSWLPWLERVDVKWRPWRGYK